ncbi:4'-phosphopantetheinyl transferase superfamily protein [Microbacterium sp. zg.B48]|uniref:4'-phosphopantetheinyl transferase family protein n=1 Tax=Microbacterium sp. zg.B48 TaxID=2969408 RepID=UPI00214AE8FB|nr:4'-phosphopantetheinyl transferase superfamily protein [Microbacterium sp. zg.B48]MCR2763286.1 4'-phosphopantetheinyl transferase superfamily protein [Microbacterium sp. zg.B48]
MSTLTHAGTRLPNVSGTTRIGDTDVVWRLGSAGQVRRASVSGVAHAWAEELVSDHGLFPWRGLAQAHQWAKPRPVGAPAADVSISHSGGMILVAACLGACVGADIEAAPFNAFTSASLLRRMCTPAEAAYAAGLPDDERRSYLARVWTAKEAIVKADGAGLALDFRTLTVQVDAGIPPAPFEAHIAVLADRTPPAIERLTI